MKEPVLELLNAVEVLEELTPSQLEKLQKISDDELNEKIIKRTIRYLKSIDRYIDFL